jgi:hypothetical protein
MIISSTNWKAMKVSIHRRTINDRRSSERTMNASVEHSVTVVCEGAY